MSDTITTGTLSRAHATQIDRTRAVEMAGRLSATAFNRHV
jgi:hypothetical protein